MLIFVLWFHRRTEFTEADDQSLVEYIAKRIPDPAHGGRLGNNLYLDLSNRVCYSTRTPDAPRIEHIFYRSPNTRGQLVILGNPGATGISNVS